MSKDNQQTSCEDIDSVDLILRLVHKRWIRKKDNSIISDAFSPRKINGQYEDGVSVHLKKKIKKLDKYNWMGEEFSICEVEAGVPANVGYPVIHKPSKGKDEKRKAHCIISGDMQELFDDEDGREVIASSAKLL